MLLFKRSVRQRFFQKIPYVYTKTCMQTSHFHHISQELEALSITELEELMAQILRIRKQKMPTVLSGPESDLLRKINATPPRAILHRYNLSVKKRQAEHLTDPEREELLELTAFCEAHIAKRLGYLVELAKIRNQTLDEVLEALQIKPRPYVIE